MNAKKCDLCGAYYDNDSFSITIPAHKSSKAYLIKFDLCLDCARDFEKWINARSGKNNEDKGEINNERNQG